MTDRSKIVNSLTLARVPLIAAWMAFALAEQRYGGFAYGFCACAAMLLSGLTDLWDGWLARKWGVVSTFGKLADPLIRRSSGSSRSRTAARRSIRFPCLPSPSCTSCATFG